MNAREQYLRKENDRLKQEVALMLAAMNGAADQAEFVTSVACAFAWDLAASLEGFLNDPGEMSANTIEDIAVFVEAEWDVAVAEMEKLNEENP